MVLQNPSTVRRVPEQYNLVALQHFGDSRQLEVNILQSLQLVLNLARRSCAYSSDPESTFQSRVSYCEGSLAGAAVTLKPLSRALSFARYAIELHLELAYVEHDRELE